MNGNTSKQVDKGLEIIKKALLSIKATGADGFEGLFRLSLTKLTGVPFRLASSGFQGGMDGDSAIPNNNISFEAKLYSNRISREAVLTKIVDLANYENAADRLWVLGATIEVSAQLAKDVEKTGDKNNISTLILDWIPTPLPSLAVIIVSTGYEVIDFLITHSDKKTSRSKISRSELTSAFKSISIHPKFEDLLQSIKLNLNVSKLAFTRAIISNIQWRKETFSSTNRTRERLGQALAVKEISNVPTMRFKFKEELIKKLHDSDGIVLSGDEGNGKSWLAAQICAEFNGMALFIGAERFDGLSTDKIEDFMIDLLIRQTNDVVDEIRKCRWRYRFKVWQTYPPNPASLLIVIDGVNQRQNIRWDQILNVLQDKLKKIGGYLIVTTRPQFWRKKVISGLNFIPAVINIPEWSSEERNELLQYYGINLDWLDDKTLNTLKNPRLLNVAVKTLPPHQAIGWKGLTTDRLLMEHIRASQCENFENESFEELTNRLSEHAIQVLAQIKTSPDKIHLNFVKESNAVIENRFFRHISGPSDLYELRDEGLTLALGFALVDHLWQAHREKYDLAEQIIQIIAPFGAIDRTFDVLFSALLVCALDENIRFNKSIFTALLDAFANLQNLNEQRFEEFVEIVRHQPDVFFDILKKLCLKTWKRINHDWFVHAAFEITKTSSGWSLAEMAIHKWLNCYNMDAEEQATRYNNKDEKYIKKIKDNINKVLRSLSSYESELLKEMMKESGDIDSLFTLALQLLAGHPLASFANSFIKMGLAFALDTGIYSARKEFQQLTTFNQIDRLASKKAFIQAIIPLRDLHSSPSGKWTVVRMLYAICDEETAIEAEILEKELRKNEYYFEFPSKNSWRKINLADLSVTRPKDMDKGLNNFIKIDCNKLLLSIDIDSEYQTYRDFLSIACRFAPKEAFRKSRNIINELLIRKGIPLRQTILNFVDHIPLVDSDLAKKLIDRITENDIFETIPEQEQLICQMFTFRYVIAQLSAEEQLNYIIKKLFGNEYLISIIPNLKHQSTDNIIKALQYAIKEHDEDTAYLVIKAALYGKTKTSPKLEELILHCANEKSSKIRSAAYSFAAFRNLNSVQQQHAKSDWNAYYIDNTPQEDWFGSILLIEACVNNKLTINELLVRIDQRTWFFAAHRLGKKFAYPLADYFINYLHENLTAMDKIPLPPVDLTISTNAFVDYSMISIDKTKRNKIRFRQPKQLKDRLEEMTNYSYQKLEREKLIASAHNFFTELKNKKMQFFVQPFTIEDFKCLVEAHSTFLSKLTEIIEKASKSQFVWLKNLAFAIANLISNDHPEKAILIFNRAVKAQDFFILDLGDGLTFEHLAIWGSKTSEPMKVLWRQRLLYSGNDEILFREVLAAERFGASSFIKSLVNELSSSKDSLDQAYAISIAGYSKQSSEFIPFIEKHLNDKSLSGAAAKYAIESHKNALWAQYWTDKMWDAQTSEKFWQYSMIAKTCIDARVSAEPKLNTRWCHFTPIFTDIRDRAIKEQKKKREKKFLGQDAPEKVFITYT